MTSEASTKTWNGRVQSGGWKTGACESMTFKASYAMSSMSVYQNGVRCTTTCRGVAKSARCHSMRLCQHSWTKNRPNAFAFFGVGDLMIASIFPRSTAMPSLLTMCPKRVLRSNASCARRSSAIGSSLGSTSRAVVSIGDVYDSAVSPTSISKRGMMHGFYSR